ncbi:CPBP family intramembrane glutamic endopeptidase [Dyella acidiphila]|uniref:CPBP family intramembrane metalloprotease n=1 Tax=Dyella acidiphila TaxID=2775866 RepID=A0ABR9G4T4_9GAMM|nr:type II CAAX endopeptidase family protein [Dyella acidiphila]MBE1159062.1 CPBP family intramembrane metalloprotease [Dyella acidiphila]
MAIDKPSSRIGIYLLLVLALSSIFYALIIHAGHLAAAHGMYVLGLMWSPATAALLTCRITGKPYAQLGFAWPRTRWAIIAWLLPLAYAGVPYLIVWVSGMGGFGNPDFVNDMRKSLGWGDAPTWVIEAGSLLLIGTLDMVEGVASGLGEEIGWRGFLAPEITRACGFTGGTLLTGVIWASWHMPILLFADYNAGTPWWFGMPCFAVMVIFSSFAFNWLRLRSGSVWPAAILHGSHNVFIQVWLTPITIKHGSITAYAIDEFGFMLAASAIVLGVVFWCKRGELPAQV